jgi:hypothetical protein
MRCHPGFGVRQSLVSLDFSVRHRRTGSGPDAAQVAAQLRDVPAGRVLRGELIREIEVAVGMPVVRHPPHRSVRAQLAHIMRRAS